MSITADMIAENDQYESAILAANLSKFLAQNAAETERCRRMQQQADPHSGQSLKIIVPPLAAVRARNQIEGQLKVSVNQSMLFNCTYNVLGTKFINRLLKR